MRSEMAIYCSSHEWWQKPKVVQILELFERELALLVALLGESIWKGEEEEMEEETDSGWLLEKSSLSATYEDLR